MRSALATILLCTALPSLADARPITAGVSLGVAQSKQDADSGADANHTLNLFGRLGFTPRLSGQLEITRTQTDDTSVDIRSVTGLLVVDLGSSGRVMPILLAGLGLDSASSQYGSSTDAHHIEGGLGLEYRAEGGFTIGADARLGGRTIDTNNQIAYPACGSCGGGKLYYAPSTLRDGEYRSARITLGIQF